MGNQEEGTVECSKGEVVDPFVMTARGYSVEGRLFSNVLLVVGMLLASGDGVGCSNG